VTASSVAAILAVAVTSSEATSRRARLRANQPRPPRTSTDEPQDNIAIALAGPAHGSETINDRLLEVDEALPAPSIYLQHGPFR
jgi:hypothetical protein